MTTITRPDAALEQGAGAGNRREADQLAAICARYDAVRGFTEELCATLEPEDYVIQSMPEASPLKWHLAHTSWFFETFLLKPHLSGYRELHPQYNYLFNSYYNEVGEQFCRPRRGQISRPTVRQVYAYRAYVDEHVRRLLADEEKAQLPGELRDVLEVGLNHEQQHQELMLCDIKHVFSINPLEVVYREHGGDDDDGRNSAGRPPIEWVDFDGGVTEIGHQGEGFAYDNESPRHRVYLEPFEIGSRLVTNGEYLEFMRDRGYTTSSLWLSDAWNLLQTEQWRAPLYWEERDGEWTQFTLHGSERIDPHEPVCHMSFYEADAFARWAGARLATENEWERAARSVPIEGNFADSRRFSPARAAANAGALTQMFGDVWEWTASPYTAYPGYRPAAGALGEYNGKFMCNQMVLRGGSCATAQSHIRSTYRNFFPPHARWQFMGIRLARSS